MNEMRKLMEAISRLEEDDLDDYSEPTPPRRSFDSPGDAFMDQTPARAMDIQATVDIPSIYMRAGDTMHIEPTDNIGEVYSEDNGLMYDWDMIFDLLSSGRLEQVDDGYPGPTVPYTEE